MARSQDKERKNRKLALRWDGPYRIIDARPPTYKLRGPDGRISRKYVHERRLRHYIAETAQSPQRGMLGELRVTPPVAGQSRESNGPEHQVPGKYGPTGPPTKRGQLVTV